MLDAKREHASRPRRRIRDVEALRLIHCETEHEVFGVPQRLLRLRGKRGRQIQIESRDVVADVLPPEMLQIRAQSGRQRGIVGVAADLQRIQQRLALGRRQLTNLRDVLGDALRRQLRRRKPLDGKHRRVEEPVHARHVENRGDQRQRDDGAGDVPSAQAHEPPRRLRTPLQRREPDAPRQEVTHQIECSRRQQDQTHLADAVVMRGHEVDEADRRHADDKQRRRWNRQPSACAASKHHPSAADDREDQRVPIPDIVLPRAVRQEPEVHAVRDGSDDERAILAPDLLIFLLQRGVSLRALTVVVDRAVLFSGHVEQILIVVFQAVRVRILSQRFERR